MMLGIMAWKNRAVEKFGDLLFLASHIKRLKNKRFWQSFGIDSVDPTDSDEDYRLVKELRV